MIIETLLVLMNETMKWKMFQLMRSRFDPCARKEENACPNPLQVPKMCNVSPLRGKCVINYL